MRYRNIAQSAQNAEVIAASLSWGGEHDAAGAGALRFVLDEGIVARNGGIDAFQTTCDWLERAVNEDGGRLIVIVDSTRPHLLSAIGGPRWESLLAMLILTFPDVRWIFSVCVGTDGLGVRQEYWHRIHKEHSLDSLSNESVRDPLLDPTGLREWVREQTNDQLRPLGSDLTLPRRGDNRLAAAIDEEPASAYLHAYTAYRFGCRADVIVTWSAMQSRFVGDGNLKCHGYWLLLEDMSLNFPDRDASVHLLDLKERARECHLLDSTKSNENAELRVLVTTGQSRGSVLDSNIQYLVAKCSGRGQIVYKPVRGMFDLWGQIGLLPPSAYSERRGNVEGFVWPPKTPDETGHSDDNRRGHGAPGKLMLVATRLTARARRLQGGVKSTEDAVRGAVLTTDALECTGGRSPTTAVDALTLKHAFEVLAECQFSGAEYHLSVDTRLEEIRNETAAFGDWFAPGRGDQATLNSEMTVLHVLVAILRENLKFDEEQTCMNRVRHLQNTLWMSERPYRFLFCIPLRYFEFLLSSFSSFFICLLFWIAGLSMLYYLANDYHSVWPSLADAITSFVAVNPPMSHELSQEKSSWHVVVVACIAIVSGFVHLGVFISHLYTIASRK